MPRISVNNLHKDFRIYERPQDRLAELILRRPRHKIYHVLSDISFANDLAIDGPIVPADNNTQVIFLEG